MRVSIHAWDHGHIGRYSTRLRRASNDEFEDEGTEIVFVDALSILGLALKTKGHLVYRRDAWVHGRAYVQLRVGLVTSPEEAGRYAEAIHE